MLWRVVACGLRLSWARCGAVPLVRRHVTSLAVNNRGTGAMVWHEKSLGSGWVNHLLRGVLAKLTAHPSMRWSHSKVPRCYAIPRRNIHHRDMMAPGLISSRPSGMG